MSSTVASAATIAINVTVKNSARQPATANLTVDIRNACTNTNAECSTILASVVGSVTIQPGQNTTVTLHTTLSGDNLQLWSTTTPHLYVASATTSSGSSTDTATSTFGVRHISFDSTDGFQLYGATVNLWGGCVHHCNGPLGSMAIDRAEERRVENLKGLGYNAIRTSHNPVSRHLHQPPLAFFYKTDTFFILLHLNHCDCMYALNQPLLPGLA